jgi:hypothetical protein
VLCLVTDAIFARQNSLHNGDDSAVFFWALRGGDCFLMRGGDICKQVARVLFAYDLGLSQSEKERLAYAECGCALGIWQAFLLGQVVFLSTTMWPLLRCRVLMHIGQININDGITDDLARHMRHSKTSPTLFD